jgi:hypothetical protein
MAGSDSYEKSKVLIEVSKKYSSCSMNPLGFELSGGS